jgi:ERO1-like protein alpha
MAKVSKPPLHISVLALCALLFSVWHVSASDTASVVPTWDVKHELACPAPSGPLEDARCDVEAVEIANNKQLYSIVEELVNTTYFRLFQINLDKKCKFWAKSVAEKKCDSSAEEEYLAALKATKPEKSQCSLDLSDSSTAAGKKKAGFSSPPPGLFGGFPGGFPVPPTPTTNIVDRTISLKEKEALNKNVSCNDTTLPEFWLDICRNIDTDSTGFVNLQLNPERWTGFNGTHVWNAIYYENCFDKLGKLDDMCYEERVLYRLLSGMHASVNIHISENYYPPSKGKRETWEPNPERFMQHFAAYPERIKNLHFSFVVLLRALRRASPYLYNFPFNVGDEWEDSRTRKLVQRLLDSHIMTSCAKVFEAFDETLMFRQGDEPSVLATLKSQFKGVFQNISEVMDCISCQKCKLHGKLELLGIGTALKILLLPEQLISSSLTRNDLVALFNTVAKFSHAIKLVPELSTMYYRKQTSYKASAILTESPGALIPLNNSLEAQQENQTVYNVPYAGAAVDVRPVSHVNSIEGEVGMIDIAFGTIAAQAAKGLIGEAEENSLVDSILARDAGVLLLAKHYAASNPSRFIQHALRGLGSNVRGPEPEQIADAIIVGGGLAGLSAALTLLDRGGRVIILEKNGHLGGNSAWASSGVNAVDENNTESKDSVEAYTQDTLRAAGRGANPLVSVLTGGSVPSLAWLRGRLQEHLKLDLVGQLGGHSFPRTHRPSTG